MFGLCNKYEEFLVKYQDPRIKGWFLVDRMEYPLVIVVAYLLFSLKLGPWLMRNRKPFDLKRPMQIYNIFQILVNTYLFVQIVHCAWIYYLNKISDLMDTVFFILRKKYNQITFLHLYHHSAMVFFTHMGVVFFPDGGHAVILGLLNTLIHTIMYTYYFIASLGPEYQKYTWWKKHLTSWQLIQFALIWVHNVQVLFRECSFPRALNIVLILEASIFLYLFGKFYIATYSKKPQKVNVTAEDNKNSKHVNDKKNK